MPTANSDVNHASVPPTEASPDAIRTLPEESPQVSKPMMSSQNQKKNRRVL